MAKITGIDGTSVLKDRVFCGDEAVAFNGRPFSDILDYVYADSMESGEIVVKREGKDVAIRFEKGVDDSLGLEFDPSVEITPKECCNNCIFCFVRQLPEGLRETLYVKDDDYRLSFISGSYITCTNLRENDIERIIDYKLSPLYISVHATDEEVRNFMLGIKRSQPLLPLLKKFIDNGIAIHAQIVLIAGINDGEILKKSLEDLQSIGVKTVAIVPVGLTGHRTGLYEISPLTAEQAKEAISLTEFYHDKFGGFCYCADEMYQIAGLDVKDPEYYGEYEQIENGVGMIAKFFDELDFALEEERHRKVIFPRKIVVFTGKSGESVMTEAKKRIEAQFPKITLYICPVVNNFFGTSVTVTGLVTAGDIIEQYMGKLPKCDYIIIPSVMLKEFGDVFLDDISVGELESKFKKKIVVARQGGEPFLRAALKGGRV